MFYSPLNFQLLAQYLALYTLWIKQWKQRKKERSERRSKRSWLSGKVGLLRTDKRNLIFVVVFSMGIAKIFPGILGK